MKTLAFCLILLPCAAMADMGPAIPKYLDETASSGVTSVYAGDWEFMTGGGVAAFDCSGDRKPELFFAGGTGLSTLYRNDSAKGGELKFTPIASGAEMDRVTGAYPLDVDGDGITDLVILRSGENVVMKGLGDCKFTRANKDWGFEGGDAWSTAFSATWEKGQNWPTFAVGNYIDRTQVEDPWGHCSDNWLHRPNGRKFAPPLALTPSYCTLSMLFTDWNRSGTPSLRVSNDREYYVGGTEQLWHVAAGQPPMAFTAAEGWKPLKIWGMGIASTDFNGDGYPDYFLTSMADNKLQVLAGKPDMATFKDVAYPNHAIAQRPYFGTDLNPSTAWHAEFQDVNNDGHQDLFVAKGNVDSMPDFAKADPNNLMLMQADGTFMEAGDKAGVASVKTARGAAVVDLNDDGMMDLVVVNRRESAELWRNSGLSTGGAPLGNWLQVALHQDGANRDGIGSWIEVRIGNQVQEREITSGGGHASGELGWLHFGLGAADKAEVRVTWPDGTKGDWAPVMADGFYDLTKGRAPVMR